MFMKKYLIILFAAMATACAQTSESVVDWKAYNVGKIIFEDQAKETEGSKIYAKIIKDPETYIAEQARDVLSTLYFSPADSIPPVENIYYTLEDVDGTHVYQLSPQGIGGYDDDRVFWCFIEGMADAVRVANGGFLPEDRPKGGNYMDGYRTTGFFLAWLKDNKDPDFLRKFNASTLAVIPWSFNGAIKHVLGEEADIDELWYEYQVAVGDIKL